MAKNRLVLFLKFPILTEAGTRMIFSWYDKILGHPIRYVFLLVNPLGYPENRMNRAPKILKIVDFAIPWP